MHGLPKISIALATYNGGKYLNEQLNSLAEQSLLPYELVVSDDGSSDDTIVILNDFAKPVPFPVHIIENCERMGYQANFLATIDRCVGDYVACCDQDDVWLRQKLQRCAEAIADDNPALLVHRASTFGEQVLESTPVPPEEAVGLYLPFATSPITWPQGMRTVLNTEVFRRYDYRNRPDNYTSNVQHRQKMSHDEYVYHYSRGHLIKYIPDFLVKYRQHESNTAGAPSTDPRVTKHHRSITGSERYVERSIYFQGMSKFFSSCSDINGVAPTLAEHNQHTSEMFLFRSKVHNKLHSRFRRTRDLSSLVRHNLRHRLPLSEYGLRSFAKDLASLFS